MLLPWIIAVLVPVLAVVGGPWLARRVDEATVFDDPMLVLIQFFIAAAPLVALAIFSVTRRASPGAVRAAALAAGLATLAIWGWYRLGTGSEPTEAAGLVLLVSPIAVGVLAVLVYWTAASGDA